MSGLQRWMLGKRRDTPNLYLPQGTSYFKVVFFLFRPSSFGVCLTSLATISLYSPLRVLHKQYFRAAFILFYRFLVHYCISLKW